MKKSISKIERITLKATKVKCFSLITEVELPLTACVNGDTICAGSIIEKKILGMTYRIRIHITPEYLECKGYY